MKFQHIHRRQILHTAALGAGALLGRQVFAAEFMDIGQAQKTLLPQAEHFLPVPAALDDARLATVAKLSDTRLPRHFSPRLWQAMAEGKSVGWIAADRVIGKYDWIDFAVGYTPQATVVGVEILAYRESHGAEVRQGAWRRQFTGRQGAQNMRFADDIRNISGATLSCQHVTEGIQRLSALVGLTQPGR